MILVGTWKKFSPIPELSGPLHSSQHLNTSDGGRVMDNVPSHAHAHNTIILSPQNRWREWVKTYPWENFLEFTREPITIC